VFNVVDVVRDAGSEDDWFSAFSESGILRFRGQGPWSQIERLGALDFVGSRFGWRASRPDQITEPLFTYEEDHSHTFGMSDDRGAANEEFVPWHVESPNWFFPQIAAGWWFTRVACRRGVGLTGFVDARDVWELLPDRFRDLALSARFCGFDQGGFGKIESFEAGELLDGRLPVTFTDVDGKSFTQYAHRIVEDHLCSDAKVLRLFPSYGVEAISGENPGMAVFVDDRPAIEEDWAGLREMYEWVASTVRKRDLQHWVQWEEDDFAIVDLHAGYHAVSGGFDPKDRSFKGIWGHEDTGYRIEHGSRPNGVEGLV